MIRAWQGLGYSAAGSICTAPPRAMDAQGWPRVRSSRASAPTPRLRSAARRRRGELPVDANVARIQARAGRRRARRASSALFDLGATVCLARVPRCDACPLAGGCPSRGPVRAAPQQGAVEGSFRQRRALAAGGRHGAAAARDAGSEAVDFAGRGTASSNAPASSSRLPASTVWCFQTWAQRRRPRPARRSISTGQARPGHDGASLGEDAAWSSPPTRPPSLRSGIDSEANAVSFRARILVHAQPSIERLPVRAAAARCSARSARIRTDSPHGADESDGPRARPPFRIASTVVYLSPSLRVWDCRTEVAVAEAGLGGPAFGDRPVEHRVGHRRQLRPGRRESQLRRLRRSS